MRKKIIYLVVLAAVSSLLLTGCAKKSGGEVAGEKSENKAPKGDVTDNLCAQFDADFTYSVIGKPIAYMNVAPTGDITYCQYYTAYTDDFYKLPGGKTMPGGPWISMKLDNLSVENQKKAADFLGWEIKTDPRIKMEHFLAVQKKDGLVNTIYLVINPNRFLSFGRSGGDVISNEEMINWAVKVAEKIQGKLSVDIQKNPLGNEVKLWGKLTTYKPEPVGESQKAVAENFLKLMSEKNWDGVLGMMDANAQTKAMWKTNFATIKSLEVKKIEPVFQEEWTATRQVFKADLNVSVVTGQGEQYGWDNGLNMRWISLEKNGETWQIHEIANNP